MLALLNSDIQKALFKKQKEKGSDSGNLSVGLFSKNQSGNRVVRAATELSPSAMYHNCN